MLYLKNSGDELGNKIKDYLLDISAAHRQVDIEKQESFISENEITIKGEVNIFRYLNALKRDLEDERLLSADACLLNPRNGEMC
ncbi:MAG: hypothetical protein AAGF85_08470 [Bacteroidota bacterium]